MKFQHLIEINDPLNSLIDPITRQQLWNGLVMRAEQPLSFVLGLDSCDILSRDSTSIERELRFGKLILRDRVSFEPLQRIAYATEAQPELPPALLTMSIEEPGPERLFVRFDYDTDTSSTTENSEIDAFYEEFRRNAYVEADIDTIGRIRQLAEDGMLNGPANRF